MGTVTITPSNSDPTDSEPVSKVTRSPITRCSGAIGTEMDGVTVLTRIERTDSRTSRVNGTTRTSTGSGTNPLLPSNLMRVRACRAHRHTIDSGARMGMGMVGVTRMLPLQRIPMVRVMHSLRIPHNGMTLMVTGTGTIIRRNSA